MDMSLRLPSADIPPYAQGGGVSGPTDPAFVLSDHWLGASANYSAFETYLGKSIDHVIGYGDGTSWSNSLTKVEAAITTLSAVDKPVEWALPLCTAADSLAEVAAGDFDIGITDILEAILAHRPDDDVIYLRWGWEMNLLNTHAWDANGNEADYIAAFQHCVDLARSLSNRFAMVWCVNWTARDGSSNPIDPEPMYPGSAYVDVIGMDLYVFSEYDTSGKLGSTVWTDKLNSSFGIQWMLDFAADEEKPVCLPEFGINTDVPIYYRRLAKLIADNDFAYSGAWNQATPSGPPSFNCRLDEGQFPVACAEFRDAFNPPATAPLDGYTSGLTVALSFGRKLLSVYAGDQYTYSIVSAVNRVESCLDQSGNSRHFPTPGTTERPVLGASGTVSRVAGVLDGTRNLDSGANASSVFLAASAYYMIEEFEASSIGADAGNLYDNDCVSGDASGYLALILRNTPAVNVYNYDGAPAAGDYAPSGLTGTFSLNTKTFVEWRHLSGNIALRINKGTWLPVSSGDTQVISGGLRWGRGSAATTFMTGKIASKIVYNAYPGDAAADAIMDRLLAA